MKIQVTISKESPLHPLFLDAPERGQSKLALRLMELGRLAGSIEQVIERTVRDSMADLSVVAAAPPASGDVDEDPEAVAALGNFVGDIFDEDEGSHP